ncbi:MAG: HAD-IIIC family phosphatase [Magnetococcales bacterium]|nr:HAD-IIIC family phosphatase [Magnetococcales bacterium]MBF0149370.1 HAD-IIIC family phosphatase [Magnetococcales bacterium]MBF0630921.1 HAD-IIIC family phosphatase [Magnetococcales bacterium]
MTFLEARKILAALHDGVPLPLLLAMSGTTNALELYLRAHAARAGMDAKIEVLPFGTLGQHLHSSAPRNIPELFLLLPWDLAAECDWRLGMGAAPDPLDAVLARAEQVVKLLSQRPKAHFVYVSAPVPPLYAAQSDNIRLAAELAALAARAGAIPLSAEHFSMATYLDNGCPVAGTGLSAVAEVLVGLLLRPPSGAFKVIATDADNTLWAGVVGEDGIDAVSANPHGRPFRHFIYQGFLRRMKAVGILLAVISRNDQDMVLAPLASGRMPLRPEDFIMIRSGYGAKSDHVRALAERLNLGVDSIVFIDDNPMELAEVGAALPKVTCLAFPETDEALPPFLDRLVSLFDRRQITVEDTERTEMYRRRLAAQLPVGEQSLTGFLANLGMVLTLHDRSRGDWTRACQLINKTNQFNLNGVRLEVDEVAAILQKGGRMFSASLEDRTGTHGEILACLIESSGRVCSLVMSCRVLQRRVEFAFLAWLLRHWQGPPLSFAFVPTQRNEPVRQFFSDGHFVAGPEGLRLVDSRFQGAHEADLALFTIREDAL